MQHRRRQHIFQAAKRAPFNYPAKTNTLTEHLEKPPHLPITSVR